MRFNLFAEAISHRLPLLAARPNRGEPAAPTKLRGIRARPVKRTEPVDTHAARATRFSAPGRRLAVTHERQ
jgi:hypothetical protein